MMQRFQSNPFSFLCLLAALIAFILGFIIAANIVNSSVDLGVFLFGGLALYVLASVIVGS